LVRFCFRLSWSVCLPVVACWAGSLSNQAPTRVSSVVRTDVRTGKLVRTMVVTSQPARGLQPAPTHPAPEGASPAAAMSPTVEQIAAEHSLPPELIHSVIKVESNYNPFAISPKGAKGMMQLIPATARRFGVSDVFNPVDNIQGGARYLKYLLDLYHGNYLLALAAYNAGEDAVARYGGVPPFAETQNYVIQVGKRMEDSRKAAAKPVETKQAEVKLVETEPAGPSHVQQIVEPDGRVRYVSR
jgi:soluble lytic murein transglycosylase-like protein